MRSSKFRHLFLGLLSLCLLYCGKAQKNPYNEVSIASPTAASLGKYGDIPVNYHTGIPQISIPIYTVKEGTLSVPISMSYHAGGMKVLETSSWVGSGWSLNAGGVITRTVMGAPDERLTSAVPDQQYGYLSDGGYHNYLWEPVSGTMPGAPLNNPANAPYYEQQKWDEFAQGKRDGEPDLFFFNVGGYSGKFFFNDDKTVVFLPEQDIKIDYDYSPGLGNSINSFTLTTPDGTKYYFGKTASTTDVDPIERTNTLGPDAGFTQGTAISSWYLNKVSSFDDKFSITFSYVAENYSYYTLSMFPVVYTSSTREYKLIKNIISGVRLNAINFSNGVVNFVPASTAREDLNGSQTAFVDDANTEAKALAEINITDNNTVCKKFQFAYDYFIDNSTPLPQGLFNLGTTDKKRLKLNLLRELSCDGTESIPPHTFTYDGDGGVKLVPRRMSLGQDYWGFVNGHNENTTLIPTYTVNNFTVVNGANRAPDAEAMKAGVLTKIQYPTGGTTTFTFEPHQTWVSTVEYVPTFYYSMTKYGTSNTGPVESFKTFSGNPIKIRVSNSQCYSGVTSCDATVTIYDATTNAFITSLTATGTNNGGSSNEIITDLLAPGVNYKIVLFKNNKTTLSNDGCDVNFYDMLPTVQQRNEIVGGLRIKKIENYDGIDAAKNVVTDFNYDLTPTRTSGVLYGRPVFVSIVRNDILRDVGLLGTEGNYCGGNSGPWPGCVTCGGPLYMKSPSPFRPLGTSQGSHIGYNQVKVSQPGNGYTLYSYNGSELWDNNVSDIAVRKVATTNCDPSVPSYPFAPLPYEYKRGELLATIVKDQNDNTIKKTEYTHSFIDNPVITPCLTATFDLEMPSQGGVRPLVTFYGIKTKKKTSIEVKETAYSIGLPDIVTTNTQYFESPYHTQVTRTLATSSKGEALEVKTKYAFDYRVDSCDLRDNCLQTYQAAVTAAETKYNNQLLSSACNFDCKWWSWQEYIKDLSNARNAYNTCRASKKAAINACLLTKKNNAGTDFKPILELRDLFINAPIEITNWSDSKLTSAAFTKYDYAVSPATKVYPTVIQKINLSNPSTTFTPSTITSNGSGLTKDSRYANETTLKFYNGNLVEVAPKAGVPTSYIWGYNNTLPIFKAVGADYNTLSAAFAVTGGNPATIRTQVSMQKALVNSYEYTPLIGMISEADPTNKKASYEYDKLWRLKNIKDFEGNIVKNYQYNYALSCGPNCYVIKLQTFTGYNTPAYPVGVFSVNKEYIGIANNATEFISLWNSNTSNQSRGTLSGSASGDFQFNFTATENANIPPVVYGLRYYQFDLSHTVLDGVRVFNGAFVDFGDGTRMAIGNELNINNLPANTSVFGNNFKYILHNYPNSNTKTITIFHTEDNSNTVFDNYNNPATSLGLISNLRGALPQYTNSVGGSSYQQASMLSMDAITNWSTMKDVLYFNLNQGDGVNPCRNINYSQDFMANNTKLQSIITTGGGYYLAGYRDANFKISQLKTNWNTYFTNLQQLHISDQHWNREDISALTKLNSVMLVAGTTLNTNDIANNAPVAIPSSVIDNLLIQVAAGAGQTVSGGTITIISSGTSRTAASDAAVSTLISKGWTISIY